MSEFSVLSEVPEPSEYVALRSTAGLGKRTKEAAAIGLPNSLFSACVRNDDNLIAMGRVVGDGGCHFEIVDVIVHTDFRERGLASQIRDELITYLRSNAPKSAYVSVVTDGGAPALYHKFGFEPTSPTAFGMSLEI